MSKHTRVRIHGYIQVHELKDFLNLTISEPDGISVQVDGIPVQLMFETREHGWIQHTADIGTVLGEYEITELRLDCFSGRIEVIFEGYSLNDPTVKHEKCDIPTKPRRRNPVRRRK